MRLYVLITAISIFIRQFVLPNPFECFGDKAFFINCIAEPIIIVVSYLLVGLFYKKGSAPALGSLLFLVTYAVIVDILWVLGLFKFAWWWILILIIAFIGMVLGVRFLCNKLSNDIFYD